MATIVASIHPRLKKAGFRKRRHTFNRSVEPGVVQVVSFQLGQRSLQGLFAVNLGIAIEEAWLLDRREQAARFPTFVHEVDCDVRERLGSLLSQGDDLWWPVDAEPPQPSDNLPIVPRDLRPAERLGELLLGPGEDWLAPRATRQRIIDIWEQGGLTALPAPTVLPVVAILRHMGFPDRAAEALRSYYTDIPNELHRAYVHEVARTLGIELSPPN